MKDKKSLIFAKNRISKAGLFNLALGAGFFLLYAATTARDILPADSGEFQLAAAGWGILHPPGYPLYTMASALWVRLVALGTPAFRLNLFSALLAAGTLVLLADAIREWAEQMGARRHIVQSGALGGALLLGLSPTFWTQATTANIRMPTMLFAAWCYWILSRFDRRRQNPGNAAPAQLLPLLALALALGVGHHPSLIFITVGWAFYLLISEPRQLLAPRAWLPAVGAGILAWLIPQLYIPIRGGMENVPLADPGLNTWNGFWDHVLARGFSGDMFAYATPAALAVRGPLILPLYLFQFPALTLILTLAGWLMLLTRRHNLAIAFFLSWAVQTFVTITYRAPQTVEYLMPAYLPLTLTFGLGIALIGEALRRPQIRQRRLQNLARIVPALPAALLILFRLIPLTPDFLTLAADRSIRDRLTPLLESAPPNALILADWHWATPLWVLQQTEGLRPDVEVAYVYPVANKNYEEVWKDRALAAGDRPLYITHAYNWSEWTALPVGGGFRLYPRPLTTLPADGGFTATDQDLGAVQLLGYRWIGEWKPGRSVELQLAWKPQGTQEPAPSFAARLFDANGGMLAQADRNLQNEARAGEIRITQLQMQLPVGGSCTALIQPGLSVYTVRDGNFETLGNAQLPAQNADCSPVNLPTQRLWPGIVLSSGPFLTGIDYHSAEDSSTTAYLHWCGPGRALDIHSGAAVAHLDRLWPGQCSTVSLPVASNAAPALNFNRPDGAAATLLSLPLPTPRPGEIYRPFGDTMILTGAAQDQRGNQTVVTLDWISARPLVDDYAVSVRPFAADGTQLGAHDYQPALSTIPTLKWVIPGLHIPDPHPYPDLPQRPTHIVVAVYERFRLDLLGEIRLPLP